MKKDNYEIYKCNAAKAVLKDFIKDQPGLPPGSVLNAVHLPQIIKRKMGGGSHEKPAPPVLLYLSHLSETRNFLKLTKSIIRSLLNLSICSILTELK